MSFFNSLTTRRHFAAATAAVLGAPGLLGAAAAAIPQPVTVDTANGRLRGVRPGRVQSFKGIPYAADTGGRNRFLPPAAVSGWRGVRDAIRLGDRCPQERETFGDAPILRWYAQTEPFSENCCVLNVFAPLGPRERRPVMVYVHGGGTATGGGGGAMLDGTNLALHGDVVVVTLNHRLNVFGYLNLGHLDAEQFGDAANAGQLDLIAALRWIRTNIATFGGDPGNVTLFGQSGGGSKIMVLMAMPAAKGLFHRAINMSGTSGTVIVPAQATEAYVHDFLSRLAIDPKDLRKLQDVPAGDLIKARLAAVVAQREGSRPVIDGRHLLASPMTPSGLALHADIPLLMGNAATEATFYFANDPRQMRLTEQQVKNRLKAQFQIDDAKAAELIDAYRQDGPTRTPSDVLVALITDTLFRIPMQKAAEAKAALNRAPVYLYNFAWRSPVDGGIWGSPHAIDIPFAFGNTAKSEELTGTGLEARNVSRQMMDAFVAFARTGNPNNPSMPAWDRFEGSRRQTMVVDNVSRAVADFRRSDRLAGSELQLEPFNRAALVTYRE